MRPAILYGAGEAHFVMEMAPFYEAQLMGVVEATAFLVDA